MFKINAKPLSVNRCWQGKRFKTKDYIFYETEILYSLRDYKPVITDNIGIELEFGLRKTADIDNPIKPILDILQKKYGFNDKNIYELSVKKVIDNKGYIKINIYAIHSDKKRK
jgi:Holliday junction resolvase RusA-like endonuclease